MNLENLIKINGLVNAGRGLQVLRDIISYLQVGKIQEAKALFDWDFDKIRNHPAIIGELLKLDLIEEHLIFGEIKTYRSKN